MRRPSAGFTLIELMVVLAIIAMLVSIALPKYHNSIAHSREAVLHEDLRAMRSAIDQFTADRGRYPVNLQELVDQRYLHAVPPDPETDSSATWVLVPPPQDAALASREGVYDVHSGAPGTALDGTQYEQW